MGFNRSACTFIIPASKIDKLKELLESDTESVVGKPCDAHIEVAHVFRNSVEVRVNHMRLGGTDFCLLHLVDAGIPFFQAYDGCDGDYEAGWCCWASHMERVLHLGGCLQPHIKQMPDCTFKITHQTLVKATLHNSELELDIDNGSRKGTLMRQLNSLNSVLNTIEETK